MPLFFVEERIEMKFQEYLQYVNSLTWDDMPPEDYLLRDGIKLSTEGAEILDIMEKSRFQGHALNKVKLLEEMGDLMYYLVHLCGQLGITLEDVMDTNYEKLRIRYPRGKFTTQDSIARRDQTEAIRLEPGQDYLGPALQHGESARFTSDIIFDYERSQIPSSYSSPYWSQNISAEETQIISISGVPHEVQHPLKVLKNQKDIRIPDRHPLGELPHEGEDIDD